jgi:hypothetical protein
MGFHAAVQSRPRKNARRRRRVPSDGDTEEAHPVQPTVPVKGVTSAMGSSSSLQAPFRSFSARKGCCWNLEWHVSISSRISRWMVSHRQPLLVEVGEPS